MKQQLDRAVTLTISLGQAQEMVIVMGQKSWKKPDKTESRGYK
jgi:hypothetical protein